MKFSILAGLFLLTFSVNSSAKNVYADVQVTNIKPTEGIQWQRSNSNTPQYPIELARSRIAGCAILSFDISESGKTKNVQIINSIPKKEIGKYSRKMLKKWQWQSIDTTSKPNVENRVLRLDFCIGEESSEQSQLACIEQTKLACN